MLAYTELEGKFDFNNTPLAPPGIKVIVHEKYQQGKTWGIYGVPGWYIRPNMGNYQCYTCYTCYTPKTRGEWHADLVKLLPQHLIIPGLTAAEQATKDAKELLHVIKNSGPQTPFEIGESQL